MIFFLQLVNIGGYISAPRIWYKLAPVCHCKWNMVEMTVFHSDPELTEVLLPITAQVFWVLPHRHGSKWGKPSIGRETADPITLITPANSSPVSEAEPPS